MTARIEISTKRLDHLGRNEWDLISKETFKSKAFRIAKALSKKELEIEVRCFDEEGDVCGHYYFEKGKLSIDMSV